MTPETLDLLLNQPAIIIALMLMALTVVVLGGVLRRTYEQPTKTAAELNRILKEERAEYQADLQAERDMAEQRIKEERARADQRVAETLERADYEIGELRRQLASVNDDLVQVREARAAQMLSMEALQKRLEEMEAANLSSARQLAEMSQRLSQQAAQIAALERENAELRQQLAQARGGEASA
ncbi:MAG TPA: hypothetical protein PKD55_01085 [Bellilinea sp.]|nr:hypothetical protein [Bellilinea sp.]